MPYHRQGTRHAARRARRARREQRQVRTVAAQLRSLVQWNQAALAAHTRAAAIAAALALLIAVGVGVGMFGLLHASTAHASAQVPQHAQQWTLKLSGGGSEPTAPRWVDHTHKTALTLRALKGDAVFQPATSGALALTGQEPYIFALTLPDDSQIVGVALGRPDTSGSLLLSTNTLVYDPATGQVTAANVNATLICDSGVLIGANARTTVTYALRARFSPDGLSAYAELAYAPLSGQIVLARLGPSASVGGVCQGTSSLAALPGAIVLDSGCPALAVDGSAPGACVNALGIAQQSVMTFDQAVIAQNWAKVYALSAPDITGQYSEAQLAATLGSHASTVGSIPALTVQASAPALRFTVGGEAFFAVDQQATLSQNGATTTRSLTSYYLFEGGQWLFWFSK